MSLELQSGALIMAAGGGDGSKADRRLSNPVPTGAIAVPKKHLARIDALSESEPESSSSVSSNTSLEARIAPFPLPPIAKSATSDGDSSAQYQQDTHNGVPVATIIPPPLHTAGPDYNGLANNATYTRPLSPLSTLTQIAITTNPAPELTSLHSDPDPDTDQHLLLDIHPSLDFHTTTDTEAEARHATAPMPPPPPPSELVQPRAPALLTSAHAHVAGDITTACTKGGHARAVPRLAAFFDPEVLETSTPLPLGLGGGQAGQEGQEGREGQGLARDVDAFVRRGMSLNYRPSTPNDGAEQHPETGDAKSEFRGGRAKTLVVGQKAILDRELEDGTRYALAHAIPRVAGLALVCSSSPPSPYSLTTTKTGAHAQVNGITSRDTPSSQHTTHNLTARIPSPFPGSLCEKVRNIVYLEPSPSSHLFMRIERFWKWTVTKVGRNEAQMYRPHISATVRHPV